MEAFQNLVDEEETITAFFPNHLMDIVNDHSYFESYDNALIHYEMLSDTARFNAFKEAIDPHTFRGKSVLDVGSGTGILAMLAAESGASKVVGVENSKIYETSLEIIRDNGMQSKVTIIKGKVEELCLNDKFDIIISEWMGYFLLFERMLEPLIIARNRFLKPGGIIMPSNVWMWIAACSDMVAYQEKTNCNFHNYRMEALRRALLSQPAVHATPGGSIVSPSVPIHTIDISAPEIRPETCCSFSSSFKLLITRTCELTGICGWFTADFLPSPVILSTSPFAPPTHWGQTNLFFETPIKVRAGSTLEGQISVAPFSRHGIRINLSLPAVRVNKSYILN